jgi:hypothetical protein
MASTMTMATAARGEISIISDQVRDFSPCSIVNSLTPVEPQRPETHDHQWPNRHGHPPWANFEFPFVASGDRACAQVFSMFSRRLLLAPGVPWLQVKVWSRVSENSFVFYA